MSFSLVPERNRILELETGEHFIDPTHWITSSLESANVRSHAHAVVCELSKQRADTSPLGRLHYVSGYKTDDEILESTIQFDIFLDALTFSEIWNAAISQVFPEQLRFTIDGIDYGHVLGSRDVKWGNKAKPYVDVSEMSWTVSILRAQAIASLV